MLDLALGKVVTFDKTGNDGIAHGRICQLSRNHIGFSKDGLGLNLDQASTIANFNHLGVKKILRRDETRKRRTTSTVFSYGSKPGSIGMEQSIFIFRKLVAGKERAGGCLSSWLPFAKDPAQHFVFHLHQGAGVEQVRQNTLYSSCPLERVG